MVFLFENHDRSLLGEFSGNLTFGASVISPTIWKTTGETPEAVPGYNDLVKQVHVPEQEPIPDEISFKVWIFDEGDEAEYTGEVSGLSGAGLRAPFGVLSIRSVQQAGSDLQVFVELGEQTNLPAALQWQGAHEVELSGASTTIQGEVSPVSEGAQTFTFPGAGTIAGPLTIRVTSWQLLSTSEHTSPVPSSACAR